MAKVACQDAKARAVFLIEKSGQLIDVAGERGRVDAISLASLAAGNIAASGGLAQLLGEKGFNVLFHEGEREHLHLSVVGQRGIVVVLFDQRSTLGLVRLRVKRAAEELSRIFADIARRVILVVLFDNRTTLGLVKLRMRHAVGELNQLFTAMFDREGAGSRGPAMESEFLGEAEDEIDKLFGA